MFSQMLDYSYRIVDELPAEVDVPDEEAA